ncbi:phosphate ABC transporter permease subunit PstC [Nitrosomonas sp. Is37]|uniref:phosphate ABC transporter permease subunit PstC n=1 Tax=Nitrosomonas sp. Is37 TaxID=3080535 RepID=UPI00294ADECA|nr:phosphate ABC transporter permease subunit PstC [Nitrosomonas sp. Is37]MDV6345382.1 phosphate ABC transporter permease subunit PstC [Nitrosomonas sp. Is37]
MIWWKHSILFRSASIDRWLCGLLRAAAGMAALIIVLILLFLLLESWPALQHIAPLRFLSDEAWYPLEDQYNLVPMVMGTLYASSGALLLAVPLGIASALFMVYYASPAVAMLYRRLIELLAGIPSVVFGFWGLTTLVPMINQWQPPGASLLTSILILTLMILPTLALTSYVALAAVPDEYLQAAAGLGFSRWGMIYGVVLPAARKGIMAGCLLAAARAVGETMAVVMVAGNVVQHADSLFAPIRTLTANIALEMAYAMGNHRAVLFVSGLLLLLLVMVLTSLAGWFGKEHSL